MNGWEFLTVAFALLILYAIIEVIVNGVVEVKKPRKTIFDLMTEKAGDKDADAEEGDRNDC